LLTYLLTFLSGKWHEDIVTIGDCNTGADTLLLCIEFSGSSEFHAVTAVQTVKALLDLLSIKLSKLWIQHKEKEAFLATLHNKFGKRLGKRIGVIDSLLESLNDTNDCYSISLVRYPIPLMVGLSKFSLIPLLYFGLINGG